MALSRWITFGFRQHEAKQLAEIEDPDWINIPSFSGAWVNYDTANVSRYRKNPLGIVELAGIVKNGATGSNIFTLPLGYRPLHRTAHASVNNTGAVASVEVAADGNVNYAVGGAAPTYLYLSAVRFRADGAGT